MEVTMKDTTEYRYHGFGHSPEYGVWYAMVKRCTDPKDPAWPKYGGAGIGCSEGWRKSVALFMHDMGPRPSSKHTLERVDNAKGYSKDNCRWATRKEQARNRRSNVFVEYKGKKWHVTDAAKDMGMSYQNLQKHLRKGRTADEIAATWKEKYKCERK
jgi:hypothetical protein